MSQALLDARPSGEPVLPAEALTRVRANGLVSLKLGVLATDGLALAAAAAVTGLGLLEGAVHVVAGLAVVVALGLHRARTSRLWTAETARIVRVALLLVGLHLVLALLGIGPDGWPAVVLGATTLGLLLASRAAVRLALHRTRRSGAITTDVLVLGLPEEADALVDRLRTNPEDGLRVAGVVGPDGWSTDAPHLGDLDDAAELVARTGIHMVVVETAGMPSARIRELVAGLRHAGAVVQLSAGLQELDQRHLHLRSVGRSTLVVIEPLRFSLPQRVAKRTLDVAISATLLLLLAPVLLVVAAAVRLGDGGPAFYRQVRVGRGGEHFAIVKFRSMVVDAEARLAELATHNERQGPLFKMTSDPRVTRLGAFLRATSIDELPQLWNVLRGDMSLVGPRPALPDEVAQFDDDLRQRLDVPAGLTGLWQVEARESEDFEAYRTLDLFYVNNWSLALDLTIVLATPFVVLRRALSLGGGAASGPVVG